MNECDQNLIFKKTLNYEAVTINNSFMCSPNNNFPGSKADMFGWIWRGNFLEIGFCSVDEKTYPWKIGIGFLFGNQKCLPGILKSVRRTHKKAVIHCSKNIYYYGSTNVFPNLVRNTKGKYYVLCYKLLDEWLNCIFIFNFFIRPIFSLTSYIFLTHDAIHHLCGWSESLKIPWFCCWF